MDLAIRALVLYAFVFVLTRVVGRRELSSLQPFDLILLIVLGDSIQQGLTQDDYSVTGALIVVGTIAGLQVLTSYLSFRLPALRPVFDGQPIVIVEDGKPIRKNLHRERLSIEDVMEEARQQQIASIDEIQWAVLETSGSISFIKKSGS
ncbi:MAG TPA: YetF domain-containing protein [Gaiellaceae bacterium]|nr:YetF domain-containing protein [Gaiellaceae bacterium]